MISCEYFWKFHPNTVLFKSNQLNLLKIEYIINCYKKLMNVIWPICFSVMSMSFIINFTNNVHRLF